MTARNAGGKEPRGARPVSPQGTTSQNDILLASMELFSERGYAATTMRQLADRAELPLSAFYYYYRSKYDILLAIMDDFLTGAEERINDAFVADDSPDVQLVSIVGAHVKHHIQRPLAARIADRELRSLEADELDEMLKRRRMYEQPFRESLLGGVESGTFAGDLDVVVAKNLILTMSTGVIDWWRPQGGHTEDAIATIVGTYALRIAKGR